MNDLVPFGKHKGKPVDALLDDRPYLDWLLSQAWFKEKFGNVYNIVINNGQEPSETPEHNAMQIKFLDRDYRFKFVFAAFSGYVRAIKNTGEPSFEVNGRDVEFIANVHLDDSKSWCSWVLSVEIKPTVGDDYPSVLRQIKRTKCEYLLIRSYTGTGATRDQFIQFFQTQGVRVVFESDVDAVQLSSQG